jgi:nicotinamidase-related amidase
MSEIRKFSEKEVLEIANKAYEQGEANFKIKADKCALLVLDMQDEFVKPHWSCYWVPEATEQVARIKQLIDLCRNNGVPVIYTLFKDTHHYLDRPKFGKFMPNRYGEELGHMPGWFKDGNIVEELKPAANEIVISKPSYGAFYDTPLETILKNLEKDTVIICGTLTNFCCGMTARQAYERGFKVIFGSDITSTDNPQMQEAELKNIRKGFGRVLNLDEIVEAIIY